MFDFTKQITLENNAYKTYKKLQGALYLLASLSAVYFAYLILFPGAYFAYDFSAPNSLKNTVISPRDSGNNYLEHGKVASGGKLVFDTALVGNYSKVRIKLKMDKQSDAPENIKVQAKKSFQAFFYPKGEPVQEKNAEIYKINDNYYLLDNGKFRKFISENAFLSEYDKDKAILSEASILEKYPIDENMIGYADGTLISYGISAYIVSSGKILPINNTVTFAAMGYSWKDVKTASADEISFYEKDKLFTISSPHPNGTILTASDTKKSYLIENGTKKPILGEAVFKSLAKNSPVSVTEKSLATIESCSLEKEALSFRTYSCDILLDKFSDLTGKDFEFYLNPDKEIKIDKIDVTFKKQLGWTNLKSTIRDLINKIMANYGIGETA